MKPTRAEADKAIRILETACNTAVAPTRRQWAFILDFLETVREHLAAEESTRRAKRRRTRGER